MVHLINVLFENGKGRKVVAHRLTHEVAGNFADHTAKNKILQEVGNEGEGHAEETKHQITDGQ